MAINGAGFRGREFPEARTPGTLRVVTSPPTDVPITVNGVARNQWGLWTFIDSGVHVVCAETAPNAVCRTVVVNGGATSVVTIEL